MAKVHFLNILIPACIIQPILFMILILLISIPFNTEYELKNLYSNPVMIKYSQGDEYDTQVENHILHESNRIKQDTI